MNFHINIKIPKSEVHYKSLKFSCKKSGCVNSHTKKSHHPLSHRKRILSIWWRCRYMCMFLIFVGTLLGTVNMMSDIMVLWNGLYGWRGPCHKNHRPPPQQAAACQRCFYYFKYLELSSLEMSLDVSICIELSSFNCPPLFFYVCYAKLYFSFPRYDYDQLTYRKRPSVCCQFDDIMKEQTLIGYWVNITTSALVIWVNMIK